MNQSMWDVVVLGGANADYLVHGPKLPTPGETVRGDTFQEAPGGKGANQAVAAARLGARVAFIGCVGMDARGDQMLQTLLDEGVDVRYVRRDNTAVTGVALIQVATNGQKQIHVAPGANNLLSVGDVLAATEALANTRILLTQLEVSLAAVTAAVRLSREAGIQIIIDAAPPIPLSGDLLSLIHVLRANTREAQALTQVEVKNHRSARQAADKLLVQGVTAAIIEAGSEGNLLVQAEGETWLPLIEVDTVDTTGAGDAFVAALAVALAEAHPLDEAARFANVAAALATTQIGAMVSLPRREQVSQLFNTLA